jgi:hypothetical protein
VDNLEKALAAIEKTLSPATAERTNRVAGLIEKLRERREKLYDAAFPIGGSGVCRDGAALKACGEIDNQIRELTLAREDLLTGKSIERPEELASPRSAPSPLPPVVEIDAKDIENPFNALETFPDDKDESKKLLEAAFSHSLNGVGKKFKSFKDSLARKGDIQTSYSRATHIGLLMTLAATWVELRSLIAVARDNRNELAKRVEALEAKPYLIDEGVWNESRTYAAGSLVSHRGAGWVAQCESRACRPGDGRLWRLAIKSNKGVPDQ